MWMEINTHDSSLGGEAVLWEERILDGEAADQTRDWLEEVVGSIGDSEHILVTWVPAHGSDTLSSTLVSGESPERKNGSKGV